MAAPQATDDATSGAKTGAPARPLVDLEDFLGSYEFSECDGESLAGESICWDYGVRLLREGDGHVTATLDGGGYQMTPYTIMLRPEPTTEDKAAVALWFAGYSSDTQDPPVQLATKDLVVVLAKRNDRMCIAFSKLKSATGKKFLCRE